MVVFAYDAAGVHDLRIQTLFKNIKKEDLAAAIGEQAPINTPEANSGTVSKDSLT